MGSVLQVPWTRLPEWCDAAPVLEELGFEIVALALSDRAESLDRIAADPPEKIALLLGSEGDGLSREAIDSAHRVITIPMSHGVDSLNVASACAVALWALRVAPSHSTHERAQK